MGLSNKQVQVLKWPYTGHTALICDGAVRTGKTSVMSLSFILWAMGNFSGCNFALCGKTVGSAERNIMQPLMGITYLREQFSLEYSRSTHQLTIKRGKRQNRFYVFGGRDESSYTLIQGVTLAGVLLDEVALMPRSFVEQALARCSVDGARFFFNCNPDSPSHWFYKEWILKVSEKDATHLHFMMDDNPSLTEETKARYRSLWTGTFYRRYILGEWCTAEGLVYSNFDRDKHVIHDLDPRGRFYISIDYGTHNPFSAGLWYLNGNTAVRMQEFYYSSVEHGQQLTDEEYYKHLEELAGKYPILAVVVDPSALSFIETIRRHGRFFVTQADNDVLDGIRYTANQLNAGRIKIHDSCVDCIREFETYSWDPKSESDKVIKEFDHAMDDTRYFCYTILQREWRGRMIS